MFHVNTQFDLLWLENILFSGAKIDKVTVKMWLKSKLLNMNFLFVKNTTSLLLVLVHLLDYINAKGSNQY